MGEVPARDRMIVGAADLLGRRGLRATSVRELAKHSGAPLGSTYHHFPGGKSEWAVAAVRFADDLTVRVLEDGMVDGPVAGLRRFVALWRQVVVDSAYRAGCPVLAVAVEEPDDDDDAPLRAAASAFDTWTRVLADAMVAAGAGGADAHRTAVLVVAAIEGTVAMCRAQRNAEALDLVAAALEDAVRAVCAPTV